LGEKPTELPFTKSRWCFVSQSLASQGEADVLRKAMGKKTKRGFG
jgi:hypothetical protein